MLLIITSTGYEHFRGINIDNRRTANYHDPPPKKKKYLKGAEITKDRPRQSAYKIFSIDFNLLGFDLVEF